MKTARLLLVALIAAKSLTTELSSFAATLPYNTEPNQIVATDTERFVLDFETNVVFFGTSEEKTISFRPKEGWEMEFQHVISPVDGTVYTLKRHSRSDCVNKECTLSLYSFELVLSRCTLEEKNCTERSLASWSYRSDSENYTSYSATHKVSPRGTERVELVKTTYVEKEPPQVETSWCNMKECFHRASAIGESKEWESPCKKTVPNDRRGFWTIFMGALSDVGNVIVCDRKSHGHRFFFDNNTKAIVHNTSLLVPQEQDSSFSINTLDGPESGADIAATPYFNGVAAVWSVFRSPYSKGIKIGFSNDGTSFESFYIERSAEQNPGTHLRLAITPKGRILFGFRPAAMQPDYRMRLFENHDEVVRAKLEESTGWEEQYSDLFLYTGAGLAYTQFSLWSDVPSLSDGASSLEKRRVIDPAYSVAPTILWETWLEGRYGAMQFGASYTQQAIVSKFKGTARKAMNLLMATVGIEDLIPFHTMKIGVRKGLLVSDYSAKEYDNDTQTKRSVNQVVNSPYSRYEFSLLNVWRVKYGYIRQSYDLRLPFHLWVLPKGEKQAKLAMALSKKVSISDNVIFIGYSLMDYAAKYNANLSDWFFAFNLGAGWSTVSGTTFRFSESGKTKKAEPLSGFTVLGDAELGWLWLRRSYDSKGLGIFSRIGARFEGLSTKNPSSPTDERNQAAEEEEVTASYSRKEFKYGVFANVGLVL